LESALLRAGALGEEVDVAKFVFRLGEVLHLHPSHIYQRFEAVVESADAEADGGGQFALRQVGVGVEQA